MDGSIRILIAEDHTIVRRGLSSLLRATDGIDVIGEASDGQEAVQKYLQLKPDVTLLDLVMPEKDGIEVIQEIKQSNPDACILVLTSFSDDNKVFPAIKAGAMGYLLKDCTPQELVEAIRQVYKGESSLHPSIARKLIKELNDPPSLKPTEAPLSQREIDVLKLVARGLSNKEISLALKVSEGTVRIHVSNILTKLHVASRTQAALYALREGYASLDQQ